MACTSSQMRIVESEEAMAEPGPLDELQREFSLNDVEDLAGFDSHVTYGLKKGHFEMKRCLCAWMSLV